MAERTDEVIPFMHFIKSFGRLSQEQFLEAIDIPYLYISNLPKEEQTNKFQTLHIRAGGDGTHAAMVGVIPVRKHPERNAFTGMITMGRAKNNDLIINDTRISKFHAYLMETPDGWTITDARSTNGTRVDGKEIPPNKAHAVVSGTNLLLSNKTQLLFLLPQELYKMINS